MDMVIRAKFNYYSLGLMLLTQQTIIIYKICHQDNNFSISSSNNPTITKL